VRRAVENETGKSDILANIEKCLQEDFDYMLVVATTKQAKTKVERILKQNSLTTEPRIKVECAQKVG